MKRLRIGFFLFEGVELLDATGPWEVFSSADLLHEGNLFELFSFAAEAGKVRTVNGLHLIADYGMDEVPQPDLLLIPGGEGSRRVATDPALIGRLKELHEASRFTMSICSGARILAAAGLLRGVPFATHHLVYDDVLEIEADAIPKRESRYTGDGRIFTSGGVSAGIDLAFHFLEKLHGKAAKEKTARYMEYG